MIDLQPLIKEGFKKFRPGFAFGWTLLCGILLGNTVMTGVETRGDKFYIFFIVALASLPWVPLLLEKWSTRLSSEIFSSKAAIHRDFHTANKLLAARRIWEAADEFKRLLTETPDDAELHFRLAELSWTELGNAGESLSIYRTIWDRIRRPGSYTYWDHATDVDRAMSIAIRIADIHYLCRNFRSSLEILETLLAWRGKELREKRGFVEERIESLKRLQGLHPATLVLFDIDGTLSHSGGAGGRAVGAAFEEIYGKPIDLATIDFRGRTDISLWREMLSRHDLPYSPDDPYLQAFQKKYLEHLRNMLLKSDPKSNPGVQPILERLAREPAVALGLLTGNIESGGRTKLQAVGLNRFFPVGGFGEDGEDRADIARAAIERSTKFYGTIFSLDRIFVVGDAEADIQAARSAGVRSIAVASGWTSKEDLLRRSPDLFLDDLRQSVPFLAAVGIQDPTGHRLDMK